MSVPVRAPNRAGKFSQRKRFLPGAQMREFLLNSCENRDFFYGIAVAFPLGNRRGAGMKKTLRKRPDEMLVKSPNCVAVMGILAEMARCLNENISKVELKPFQALGMRGMESARAIGEVSQA
jgi:hypothetical protein